MVALTEAKAIDLGAGEWVVLDGERDRVVSVPHLTHQGTRVRFRSLFGRVVEMPADQLVTVERGVL